MNLQDYIYKGYYYSDKNKNLNENKGTSSIDMIGASVESYTVIEFVGRRKNIKKSGKKNTSSIWKLLDNATGETICMSGIKIRKLIKKEREKIV